MKHAAIALFSLLSFGAAARAQAPVPFVSLPLVPTAVAPGGPAFTLTVNGTMFVQGATINWNGQPLPTTFISGSQLEAAVPATDIASPSMASIAVTNPGVPVASNAVHFQAMAPESTVYFEDAPGTPVCRVLTVQVPAEDPCPSFWKAVTLAYKYHQSDPWECDGSIGSLASGPGPCDDP